MMTQLFCVFDGAARRFLDPFCAPTSEVAIRGFRQVCTREGHQFNEFPEDYTLFHIGHFDPETGQLNAETPRSLGNGLQFITPQLVENANG